MWYKLEVDFVEQRSDDSIEEREKRRRGCDNRQHQKKISTVSCHCCCSEEKNILCQRALPSDSIHPIRNAPPVLLTTRKET